MATSVGGGIVHSDPEQYVETLVRAGAGGLSTPRCRGSGSPPTTALTILKEPDEPVYGALLDNRDSFVYNLYQYLGELGAEPPCGTLKAIDVDQIRASRRRIW